MTETPGPYDIAPTRCHCDSDWAVQRDSRGRFYIVCASCTQMIMNFEAVARWNEQRAEIEQMRRNNRGLRTLVETHEELKAKYIEKIEQLQAILRDVESWTALDEETNGSE